MDEVDRCVSVFVLLEFTMEMRSDSASDDDDDNVSFKGHASLAMFVICCCSACSFF